LKKDKDIKSLANQMIKSGYGKYLLEILNNPLKDQYKDI